MPYTSIYIRTVYIAVSKNLKTQWFLKGFFFAHTTLLPLGQIEALCIVVALKPRLMGAPSWHVLAQP